MGDVDPNQVVAHAALEATKRFVDSIYGPISDFIGMKKAIFLEDFRKYCEYVYIKNSQIRTIISKNKSTPLLSVYTNCKFLYENKIVEDLQLIQDCINCDRLIVRGNGGTGKTFFMKYLWLDIFQNPRGKIPIFIELRRMNEFSKIDLVSFIRNELQSAACSKKEIFEQLCDKGRFVFIFDAFDEIARSRRAEVERQILELSMRYRKCGMLVSGRSDDRFGSWHDFKVHDIRPLSLRDTKSLIDKIEFDNRVKKKFKSLLDDNFYNQYKSFLSNPLLATMMLMTFHENASIPSKISTFYERSFQTLLTWHDATKDSFERDRALDEDAFRKVFATFCLISYYNSDHDFEDHKLREYITKSLEYHKAEVSIDDAKSDVCEAVNLLHKDGLKYHFVHRSFQEYFAAFCSMRVVAGNTKEFLSEFASRHSDSVFRLCYDIHPELVIDEYLIPEFAQINSSGLFNFKKSKPSTECLANLEVSIAIRLMKPKSRTENAKGPVGHWILERLKMPDEHDFLASMTKCYALEHQEIRDSDILNEALFDFANATIDACKELRLKSHDFDKTISVEISFTKKGVRISCKNCGDKKISIREINELKSKIRNRIEETCGNRIKDVHNWLSLIEVYCRRDIERRSRKGQAIEELLGI